MEINRRLLGTLFALGLLLLAFLVFSMPTQAAACSGIDWSPWYANSHDSDGDGLDDTASFGMITVGTGYGYDLNATITGDLISVEYNGSVASNSTLAWANNSTIGGWSLWFTVPSVETAGNFTVEMDFQEGGFSCGSYSGNFELYPLGVYNHVLARGTANQTAQEGTVANYTFTVRNEGNNPDTISLYAVSSQSWFVDLSVSDPTLDPGQRITLYALVYVPDNADPNLVDLTTITGISLRDFTHVRTLVVKTTVAPQVFDPNVSADRSTDSAWPGAAITFDVKVTNEGNNHDNLTLSLPAAPIGWTFSFAQSRFALDAGENATTQLTVWVATSLAGALAWDPAVTVTAGNGVAKATYEIHLSTTLPDLVVTQSDIVADNMAVPAGSTVAVHVTVRNLGATVAVDAVVRLSDGLSAQSSTVSMDASGVAVATFAWKVSADHATLTATADSTSAVPESSEDNNQASVTLGIDKPPTAATSSAALSGQAGQGISISAAGSTDAEGTVVAYSFDFGDGSTTGWITTSNASHTFADAGTYFAKVWARDSAGLVSEPATVVVTVAPGSTTGGTQSAGTAGSSDVTFALLGVVAGLGLGMAMFVAMGRKKPPA